MKISATTGIGFVEVTRYTIPIVVALWNRSLESLNRVSQVEQDAQLVFYLAQRRGRGCAPALSQPVMRN